MSTKKTMTSEGKQPKLEFRPLTKDRWADFEALFGERGACGGCWCMWWRLKRSEFEKKNGKGNKKAMKAIAQNPKIEDRKSQFQNSERYVWSFGF